MAGPWEKYGGGQQAPAQPAPAPSQFPGVIQGRPKPADPLAVNRDIRDDARLDIQAQTASIQNELAQIKIQEARQKQQEAADKRAKAEAGMKTAADDMRRVIAAAQRAKELSRDGWFATGFGAETAKEYGGTAAADVDGLLTTIGASTAFDRLQRMRDESPTGGALGQVAVPELNMLRDSIASLKQSQSDAEFQRNMDIIIESYGRVLSKLEGEQPQDEQATQDAPAPASRGDQGMLSDGAVYYEDGRIEYPDGTYSYLDENGNRVRGETVVGEFGGGGQYSGLEGDNRLGRAAPGQEGLTRNTPGFFDVAKQGMTLGLSDEAAGVGAVIGRALTGDFNVARNYAMGRDVERFRIEEARNNMGPVASTATELVAGAGSIRNAPNALMSLGRGIAASGQPVTRAALQQGLVRQGTRAGAGVGAVGGFGYGEGAEGSVGNALLGAAAGGALGNVGARMGNAAANRPPPGPGGGARAQAAADDLGIELTPAVTGGATTRRLTAGAQQGFISQAPIQRAVTRMETQGEAARNRIANDAGRVLDDEVAGDVVREAANVYSRRTSQIGGNLYKRADARAGGAKMPLPTAVQAADAEMAQIAKAPGGTDSQLYKDLAKLREQMSGGSFEVDGIRAFRTTLRNEMTERGLRGTPQDVAYGKILQAAEDDMIAGLQQAGKPEAAQALKTAAAFWRKRVETIDQVLEPVLGKRSPKSGEQIVKAIESLANPKTGNSARLRGLFAAMPKDEARSISATLINRMGQPTRGSANIAEEGGFSFNTFLTNYNDLSPRAKATIFPKESREALDKLATVSKAVKEAGGAANTSNTAGALTAQLAISGIPAWIVSPFAALGMGASQYAAGRLLASPKFARLLAGAPKANTAPARRAFNARLTDLAKTEPALQREIGMFQQAMNDNVAAPLAAEPTGQEPQ